MKDSSGGILTSYIDDGVVCHEITPVSIQKTVHKHNVSVSLCVPDCSWNSSTARRDAWVRIRKVVLAARDVPFTRVIDELAQFYSARGRRLLGARMQLDGEPKHQTWLNPVMTEAIGRMEAARAKANKANDNGSAKRFWEKSLELGELEVGLTLKSLQNEIENFSRPFKF